ncbi:MAG: substrate-binding domain-containing protein, partial [Thermodesulfobacteriota bacterium]
LKALEMVESGQVEGGLVSYGDLSDEQKMNAWIVPSRMHNPIKQAMVAIKGGDAEASAKWMKFMESDTAKNVLMSSGYGITNVEVVK